jgi:hypothetical protein
LSFRILLAALLILTPAATAQETSPLQAIVVQSPVLPGGEILILWNGTPYRAKLTPFTPGPIPPGPTPGPTPEPTPDPLPPVPTPVTGPLWALLVVPSGNNVTAEQAALRTDAELRAEAKRLGITWLTFQDGESELSQKGYAPKIAETGTPVLLIVDGTGDYRQTVTKPTKPQILTALRAMRGD